MNQQFVSKSIGILLQMLAVAMSVPLVIALVDTRAQSVGQQLADAGVAGFVIAIAVAGIVGTLVRLVPGPPVKGNTVREGFAIVTFGWIVLTVVGCIPLYVYFAAQRTASVSLPLCFTNAFFEVMSGFSTTGATILTDIEKLPRGLLFWRSMTHWLGGMGIVTLVLAVFPAFGVAAYQMFRGEVPGPTAERLRPRLGQTAKILWGVYALLTGAQTLLLMVGGMDWFEALCHAFGTLATGGFSTRNASVAAYNSAYIDWVVIVFMFLAGVNFLLHYRAIFWGDFRPFAFDREFRFYALVTLGVSVLCVVVLQLQGIGEREMVARSFRVAGLDEQALGQKLALEAGRVSSFGSTLRYVVFQVVSVITTTGFVTADFDTWPSLLRFVLVVVMFFGGCAGSTGGGMKMVRVMVVLKVAWREVMTMIQPRHILPVRLAEKALEEKQVRNIVGFFLLFILLFVAFSAVMCFFISDFTTAVTAVVATLCNVGPGLSGVGAFENYAWIPSGGKWVLALCMLLGRLEVFTVLIAFSPLSWRK